jgi:hypothetical protein
MNTVTEQEGSTAVFKVQGLSDVLGLLTGVRTLVYFGNQ